MTQPGTGRARLTPDERIPGELFAHIRATVARTTASRVDTPMRVRLALSSAATLFIAVVIAASEIVYQRYASGMSIEAVAAPHLWVVFTALLAVASFATFVGLRRGSQGFGFTAPLLLAVSALVAPTYATLVLVHPVHADSSRVGVEISPWGLRCLLISTIVGSGVLLSFTLALRRAVPSGTTLRGATLGAAAGAWAGLGVFMFCPAGDLRHLIVGHVLPVAAFTLLAMIVAPRLLRP